MPYSTRISLTERIADFFGINNHFHKFKDDLIDNSPDTIISPVEAELVDSGKINKGKITSKSKKEIDLKDVMGKSADLFSDGFYFNFYLHPANKHYWGVPYDGKFISTKVNNGQSIIPVFVGLESIPFIGKYFSRFDLFEKAVRKNASIASVLQTEYFPIGMIAVGSLNVNGIHVFYGENKDYERGDICGYFSIGSSMLLCFPKYPLESLINKGEKVDIGIPIVKIKGSRYN